LGHRSIALVGCQTIRNSGTAILPDADAEALRIATYNVHYIVLQQDTGAWSLGDWERRKIPLDQAFKAMDADVIGFQEMESFARGSEGQVNLKLDWLLEQNPGYAAAAVGDPAAFPSTQPIFYRTEKLALVDQGWFFFSDTPDVIYSRTFNGSFPAFTSWAQFRDIDSGASFRVVNVHTDYASRSNRLQSVALVADRITPWIDGSETVFLVGDINARLGDRTIDILVDTGLSFAPVKGATYHFNRGINLFGAIDHIASAGDATLVGDPVVLRQKFSGEWPTDHYPVIADYRLGASR
jgi:endonuclease/exonuclease/phosphatase family metal-dependent hydrolase